MPDLKTPARPDVTTDSGQAVGGDASASGTLEQPAGADGEPPSASLRRTLQVSVVVPTCGRVHLLQRCLASLVVQQLDTRLFEIIVVDDAIAGARSSVVEVGGVTGRLVQEWAMRVMPHGLMIRYLPPTPPTAAHGPAAARNRGWRCAGGDIIAFTDDDTQARVDWLACGLAAFAAPVIFGAVMPAVDAVWGRIVMPLHGPATDYELDAKGLERAQFVTANCFCTKACLERIGGFDERFRLPWREDADLYFALLDHGAHILHVPSAVVVHPVRPAQWGVSLGQQRKILFDALLFKKHPAHYRAMIRKMPRWDYYVIVLALVLATATASVGRFTIAVVSASVWLLLTALFCLRRLRPATKTPAHVLEMIVTSALIPPLAVFWRIVGAVRFRVAFL